MTLEKVLKALMEGNRRFVLGAHLPRDLVKRRAELVSGQKPHVTILSCSDSRVVPEYIFDADLGELFTVITAGNVADNVALGSIEYGVGHLHTPVLMVLGHTRCGAVTTTCEDAHGDDSHSTHGHISHIRRKIRGAAEKGKNVVEHAIEENVHHQKAYILEHSTMLRNAVEAGKLTVVTAIYALETGEVQLLD